MLKHLLLFASGSTLLLAQTPVGGPSLGFVFDEQSQALRPIVGTPGAAFFADPLPANSPITAASFSLQQNLAVVYSGGWIGLPLSAASAGNPTALPAGVPATARVEVSETGKAAAFYDTVNDVVNVVTGLGGSSPSASPVNLSALPGPITRFAVADDGSLLTSVSAPAGGEALFWIGQDGSVAQLATLQATSAILLWNSGKVALVSDTVANQVWRIDSPGASAAMTLVASASDGVSGPVGAALSADGSQLWIANGAGHNVLGINLATRATTSLPCAFRLITLVPMADGSSFQLSHAGNEPLWLLDTSTATGPRIAFIPAMTSEVSQ